MAKSSHKKVIINALKYRIKAIAFEANLFEKGLSNSLYGKKCSKEKKILEREIEKYEQT